MIFAWLAGGAPADILKTLLAALALDAILGDPKWLYRALPHPVVLIGRLVAAGDRWLNEPGAPPGLRVLRGGLLTAGVVGLTAAVGAFFALLLEGLAGGWFVEALLASTLIAFRGLHDHGLAVARGLDRGLEEGRAAVAHIVGRDPDSLDEAGVARAAVESLAENFSDGVVAPAFWFAAFGLPGLCAYKAVNTLDSMIGYRNERYLHFGRVAARLDDAVNWLPARLAGGLAVAAAALAGADAGSAWRVMLRDAPKHRSPNAGWQEAAFAGALGFALAGPRRYGSRVVEDHWMGDGGRRDLGPADIRAALRLYLAASLALATLVFALWLAV